MKKKVGKAAVSAKHLTHLCYTIYSAKQYKYKKDIILQFMWDKENENQERQNIKCAEITLF
jgi:hypothetical protein